MNGYHIKRNSEIELRWKFEYRELQGDAYAHLANIMKFINGKSTRSTEL